MELLFELNVLLLVFRWTTMISLCFSDRLGYDNDFAWEEARYPGSRNGLTHFRRFDEENFGFPSHFFSFSGGLPSSHATMTFACSPLTNKTVSSSSRWETQSRPRSSAHPKSLPKYIWHVLGPDQAWDNTLQGNKVRCGVPCQQLHHRWCRRKQRHQKGCPMFLKDWKLF